MNDGGPAFPVVCNDLSKYQLVEPGMSLRDWFAGMAMQAFLSEYGSDEKEEDQQIAEVVYKLADAMIAERNKSGLPNSSLLPCES
jgi:hypothetical protein